VQVLTQATQWVPAVAFCPNGACEGEVEWCYSTDPAEVCCRNDCPFPMACPSNCSGRGR
jgi:hypothetical protein